MAELKGMTIELNISDKYEDAISSNQNLTFETLESEFKRAGLELNDEQMFALGLKNAGNRYTNLAFWLSEQCECSTKAVVIRESMPIVKKEELFQGSLLKQLRDIGKYMSKYHGIFLTCYADDLVTPYPEEAIQEAIINAIIHRDYSISDSNLIKIYADRIEFISIGGIANGFTRDDIMLGVSALRNSKLSNIMRQLNNSNLAGNGIIRIHKAYSEYAVKPIFEVSDNIFKLSLPNKALYNSANERECKIISYLIDNQTITRSQAQELLKIDIQAAGRTLSSMLKRGAIKRLGTGKYTRYALFN